jgi:hypothetical protein
MQVVALVLIFCGKAKVTLAGADGGLPQKMQLAGPKRRVVGIY